MNKKWLTIKEIVFITSMLFGLFFGAGNLIFPIYMGQVAGRNMLLAGLGFLITGVGLPILAVVALGKSKSNGLYELSSKVSPFFSIFFTVLLYLMIGPFLAIPRCATVSYTVGIEPIIGANNGLALFIFSLCFFILALTFALKANQILVWVGKILNPFFLIFLFILIGKAFISPMADFTQIEPTGAYVNSALTTGFFEGYNTLDALAGLAFGIIVVNVIKGLDIKNTDDIANNTIISGVFSGLLMAVIYIALVYVGSQSRNVIGECANGGEIFSKVAKYYFGDVGAIILAITISLACLKTSIGLITSCAETFYEIFPKSFSLKKWTFIFTLVSFVIANFGLNQILMISVPALMFIYPLAITLIVLLIFEDALHINKSMLKWAMYLTFIPAVIELIVFLPTNPLTNMATLARNAIPLGSEGFSFVVFALVGLIIGFIFGKR